ncbi:small G-beta protein GPB, partial [Reticulomyxa filosa]
TIRLWDIRMKKETKIFKGHIKDVTAVEYLPFVKNSINTVNKIRVDSDNTICSVSLDKTIRFWDIQMNKELYIIQRHAPILCFQILLFNNKERNETNNSNEKVYNHFLKQFFVICKF